MVRTKKPILVGPEDIMKRRSRILAEYSEALRKSERFDIRGYTGISAALSAHICDDRYNRCCDLVLLYARMGLHRYNLLQGTHLQLSSVKMYNRCITRCYYITLEAKDPATETLQTFQAKVNEVRYPKKDPATDRPATEDPATLARVDEHTYGGFLLTCTVARLLDSISCCVKNEVLAGRIDLITNHHRRVYLCIWDTQKSITPRKFLDGKHLSSFMPELPPENPFQDDTTRFYVLKESELQDNDDWIRLYVELAVATPNTREEQGLANLKILEVAMESTRQGLGAYDETFYIRYVDSCEARVGKDVDRVAIVRRILDEHSEILSLVGRHQSIIPMEAGSSSAQD